jgi:hypothetical protein
MRVHCLVSLVLRLELWLPLGQRALGWTLYAFLHLDTPVAPNSLGNLVIKSACENYEESVCSRSFPMGSYVPWSPREFEPFIDVFIITSVMIMTTCQWRGASEYKFWICHLTLIFGGHVIMAYTGIEASPYDYVFPSAISPTIIFSKLHYFQTVIFFKIYLLQ